MIETQACPCQRKGLLAAPSCRILHKVFKSHEQLQQIRDGENEAIAMGPRAQGACLARQLIRELGKSPSNHSFKEIVNHGQWLREEDATTDDNNKSCSFSCSRRCDRAAATKAVPAAAGVAATAAKATGAETTMANKVINETKL